MTIRTWAWSVVRIAWRSWLHRRHLRGIIVIELGQGTEVTDAMEGVFALSGLIARFGSEPAPASPDLDAAWADLQRRARG